MQKRPVDFERLLQYGRVSYGNKVLVLKHKPQNMPLVERYADLVAPDGGKPTQIRISDTGEEFDWNQKGFTQFCEHVLKGAGIEKRKNNTEIVFFGKPGKSNSLKTLSKKLLEELGIQAPRGGEAKQQTPAGGKRKRVADDSRSQQGGDGGAAYGDASAGHDTEDEASESEGQNAAKKQKDAADN
jgi:hypothetical protein